LIPKGFISKKDAAVDLSQPYNLAFPQTISPCPQSYPQIAPQLTFSIDFPRPLPRFIADRKDRWRIAS
jgi:hypothetical protein